MPRIWATGIAVVATTLLIAPACAHNDESVVIQGVLLPPEVTDTGSCIFDPGSTTQLFSGNMDVAVAKSYQLVVKVENNIQARASGDKVRAESNSILLTGATGLVGSTLLPRLVAGGARVRCLVRDPKRLGAERVRVQIALGDLSDPPSFRNAMRGVSTVVHLAAAIRDQPAGSIEELNGIATWRMVEAAERAGVERFVFFTALGATAHDRTRFLRAKALAEDAVSSAGIASTTFACSVIYAPGDPWLTLVQRLSLLPAAVMSGSGRALFQPIWAEDVAACVEAALARPSAERVERFELAGPETLSHEAVVRLVLQASGHERPLVRVPVPVVRGALRLGETLLGAKAPAVWDEAELLEVSSTTARGVRDVEALGVVPRPMGEVLGLAVPAAG